MAEFATGACCSKHSFIELPVNITGVIELHTFIGGIKHENINVIKHCKPIYGKFWGLDHQKKLFSPGKNPQDPRKKKILPWEIYYKLNAWKGLQFWGCALQNALIFWVGNTMTPISLNPHVLWFVWCDYFIMIGSLQVAFCWRISWVLRCCKRFLHQFNTVPKMVLAPESSQPSQIHDVGGQS